MKKVLLSFLILIGLGALVLSPINDVYAAKCGGANTSIINCDDNGDQNAIIKLLTSVINILSAGVGILAIAGYIYAGLLYTTAGADPKKVKASKDIFTNVTIGIIAYLIMWSVIEWLIPGGVF
ncbi:hypothetical protein EUA76_00375 [TM7 phylum sp. oral taxon 350]|jgi:hypothetical protein|nr:hypothetical protein EUA76_00375 [TM7 phylum sp. oral taxon 350]